MIQLASLQKYFSNEKNNSKVNYIKLPPEHNSKKLKKVHPETVLDETHSDTSHFNGNRKKRLPGVESEVKSNETFEEIPQCATGLELIKLYKVWSFQGKLWTHLGLPENNPFLKFTENEIDPVYALDNRSVSVEVM